MRTKIGQRMGVLGVLVASATLGGLAPLANAGQAPGRGYHAPHHVAYDAFYAGTLRVGDYRFDFRSDSFVRDEIAYRFRRLGYDAWGANEKVYVRVGHRHRPLVRWLSGTHRVVTWYEGDCLVMKVIPPTIGRGVVVAKPRAPAWRQGRVATRGPWRGPSICRVAPRVANGRWW